MIRFAIIGAGSIAHRFMDSLVHEKDASLYAIFGRNREKLEAFREKYPCEKIYTDLEELLNDSNVDAVYVSLPNELHKDAVLKALDRHIPVLCEKPAVLSVTDMKEIMASARKNDTLFMEAMKSRFTPLYRKLKEEVGNGLLGDLVSIDTSLIFHGRKEELLKRPGATEVPAGCGIYGVSFLEDFLGDIHPVKEYHAVYQSRDFYIHVTFKDKQGRTGTVETGIDLRKEARAVLRGTKGYLVIPDFHRCHKAILCLNGKEAEELSIPLVVDDFSDEIRAFLSCIEEGKKECPLMPLSKSLRLQEILEEMRKIRS
ncbi:MAG: Gfo/Idh/MocA family oxidoreductase [Erysipelotrichaceae bacterium]|nr:Gfo/Idh/MocA family oxidoreductase [Erysipelotrichaceae bacterium]